MAEATGLQTKVTNRATSSGVSKRLSNELGRTLLKNSFSKASNAVLSISSKFISILSVNVAIKQCEISREKGQTKWLEFWRAKNLSHAAAVDVSWLLFFEVGTALIVKRGAK